REKGIEPQPANEGDHMAQQTWVIVRGGKETGPFNSTQLKDSASSGTLKPNDLVRRGDVETARPASQIKGLFSAGEGAGVAPSPKPLAGQPTATAPTFSKKWLLIVAAAAAALFLLCSGVAVIGVLFTQARQAAQKELADA